MLNIYKKLTSNVNYSPRNKINKELAKELLDILNKQTNKRLIQGNYWDEGKDCFCIVGLYLKKKGIDEQDMDELGPGDWAERFGQDPVDFNEIAYFNDSCMDHMTMRIYRVDKDPVTGLSVDQIRYKKLVEYLEEQIK